MDVTLPNGQVINDVPDGTTKAQLAQKLQSNGFNVPPEWIAPPTPTASQYAAAAYNGHVPDPQNAPSAMDIPKGIASGFADVGNTLLNGAAKLAPKGSFLDKWNAARSSLLQDFNNDNQSPAFDISRLGGQVAATWPVGGVLGKVAEAVGLPMLGKAISQYGFSDAPLATNVAGGAIAGGATTGLTNPDNAGTGALISAALPVVGKAANIATAPVMDSISNARSAAALKQAQNATYDNSLQEAVNNGYKLPVGYGDTTGTQRVLAGLSSNPKLKGEAVVSNVNNTNQLARDYLGLPASTPLSDEVLSQQRDALAAPYRDASNLPEGIVGQSQQKNMATGNIVTTPIKYDGDTLVNELKQTRLDAKNNWDSFKRTGSVDNQQTAQALDSKADDLENKLIILAKQNGDSTLAQRLSDARTAIAKNYMVDRALNSDTGNVDARVFARAKNNGAPLTDEGAKIASFANAFPDVARPMTSTDKIPVNMLDGLMAGGLGLGSHFVSGGLTLPVLGAAVGVPTSRVMARKYLLSDPVQQAMANPKYGIGPTKSLLEAILGPNYLANPLAYHTAPLLANQQ